MLVAEGWQVGEHPDVSFLRRFREVTHRCSREVTHLLGNQELN
jgi:hypothetical protein